MGVIGLTSFMNNSILDDILQDINLKNSILLIDGFSLMHRIYFINNLECIYGGDYDYYATKLDDFFNSFKKCKIEPIFLLDGAKDLSEKKFKTNLKRANQRLNNLSILNNYTSSSKSSKNKKNKNSSVSCPRVNLETLMNSTHWKSASGLMPIMIFNVFKNALDKFEFIYYQCDFEADYDLACLANQLKCPLLSYDSDFYIYNLKYGYISFDYFDMEAKKSTDIEDSAVKMDLDQELNQTEFYFSARLYKIDKFIEYINTKFDLTEDIYLNKSMLPIFAILCGNDYVERSTFESILKTFDSTNNNIKHKKNKNSSNYLKNKTNYYNRLLEWLCQFENTKDCLNTMLKFIKTEKHETVCQIVSDSIEDYMCLKPSLASSFKYLIKDRLKRKNIHIFDENETNSLCFSNEIIGYDNKQVNSKFLAEYHQCKIGRICLDVLLHRKLILNCQVEYINWPSTFESSTRIRKLFYSSLIKSFAFNEMSKERVIVKEYLRHENQIKIFDVLLDDLSVDLTSLIENGSIYFYRNVYNFDDRLIRNLMSNEFENINKKLLNLFSIIFYWLYSKNKLENSQSQSENPIKVENYLRGFIVSLIKTLAIDKCFSEIKTRNLISEDSNEPESISKYDKQEGESIINNYFHKSKNLNDLVNKLLENKSNYEYIKAIKLKMVPYCQSVFHSSNSNSNNKLNKYLNIKLAHSLCEFQAIYFSISNARDVFELISNSSLANLKLLDLEFFYNGTFLHNFIDELERRSNPDLFVEELFGRKSFFKHLYYEFIDLFKKIF